MQTQLKITLQDLPHSDALDARIRAKAAKLEKAFPRLTGCHVVVSEPHRRQQNPREFAVRMNVAFPGGEVVVTRDAGDDVYVLLRDAFAAAERELERKLERRQVHGEPHHGFAPRTPLTNQESGHE